MSFPGHKELEPLKYSKVAAAVSTSRRKVEVCVEGTTSLLSHCLAKGQNVALVLRDVGVLLIERTKVQMRFYHDLVEKITGKKLQQGARLKVSLTGGSPAAPWHLPLSPLLQPSLHTLALQGLQLLSPKEPIAGLTFTGRVLLFPE